MSVSVHLLIRISSACRRFRNVVSCVKDRLMQQVKIFKSVDTEIPEMERQINRWMRKSGARVLSITGNLASQLNRGHAVR